MANEKQLRNAAKEMNRVMVGLEPPIDVQAKMADLVAEMKEAIEYIDPKDEFTDETQAVIDSLKEEDQKAKVAERLHKTNIENAPIQGEEDEDEEVDDTEERRDFANDQDDEEEEEEEVPPPVKKAPAPRVANGYVRIDAICDALKDKPESIADWIALANKYAVDHGGRENNNENKALIKLVSKVISHVSKSTYFPTE